MSKNLVLTGMMGVGKSTIFHIITGLKDPSFGKVLINGTDCTNIPIYERATRFKIGYVPQYGGYFHDLTLIENLKAVGEIIIKNERDTRFVINITNAFSLHELQFNLKSLLKSSIFVVFITSNMFPHTIS